MTEAFICKRGRPARTEEQEGDPNSKFGCLVIDTEQKQDCLRYRRNFKQLYLQNLE